jgi:hypothetical protein
MGSPCAPPPCSAILGAAASSAEHCIADELHRFSDQGRLPANPPVRSSRCYAKREAGGTREGETWSSARTVWEA